MKLIQPHCRIQFTAEDIDFVLNTLGRHQQERGVLVDLLADEETRDLILEDDAIFRRILEQRSCLRVSTRFYFYIIVRNVLKSAGIEDRNVADYLAELLTAYSHSDQMQCHIPGQRGPIDYFFEMLAALETADDRTSFYIRAHIGNHSLFLSGVFPERIRYRAEYKGFPDLRYYEALGQSAFRIASDHRLAAKYELAPIYSTLADRFQTARQALNEMSERLLSLSDIDPGWDNLLLSKIE